MSIYLYEKVLVDQLRKVTGDERVHIIDPQQAVTFLAQIDRDKVDYPAIVLKRNSVSLGDYRNQVVALKGENASINDNILTKAKLVPVHVEWEINVFAVDRYTCDEIVRELVFYFIINPRFNVKIPYGLDIDQNFDVFLQNDIVDNTDLNEFPNTGEFFRETITIYTDNAHFYTSGKQYVTAVSYDFDTN